MKVLFSAVVVCRNFFGASMLAGYFFQNHPSLPSEVEWSLLVGRMFLFSVLHGKDKFPPTPSVLSRSTSFSFLLPGSLIPKSKKL